MSEHTLKFFGDELTQLKAEVTRMGGLVEAQVEDSIECVVRRDVELAQSIIGRDAKIDELQRDIERKAIRMIALRQPVAQDLRRTVAALKMAWNLERTGDQAKNIAKRALVLAEAEPLTPLTRAVERMGRLVVAHLRKRWTPIPAPRSNGAWPSGVRTRTWTSTTTPCSGNCSPT